jgi:hypothetical protein
MPPLLNAFSELTNTTLINAKLGTRSGGRAAANAAAAVHLLPLFSQQFNTKTEGDQTK